MDKPGLIIYSNTMRADKINNLFGGRIIAAKDVLLFRLVQYIPASFTPNMMTMLRTLLIIPIFAAYQQAAYGWMLVIFFLALFTDLLHGVHARYYNLESKLGKLLDPAADKILFIGTLVILAPGRLSEPVLYTLIILETILVLLAVVIGPVLTRVFNVRRKIGANNAGKIKLTLEGSAIIVLLLGQNNDIIILVSEVILWLAAICALASIILHIYTPAEKENPNASQR